IVTRNIQPGPITMTLGSSVTVYPYADDARVSEQESVATFCSSSGGWQPLICTMNLTNATTAIREKLALDVAGFNETVA
ncbi:xylulokinase, partial [Pseudomonas syringae pv. tagetis]